MNFRQYVPKTKPLLAAAQRKMLVDWCKKHKTCTIEKWNDLLQSDESRFCIGFGDGNVWRTKS